MGDPSPVMSVGCFALFVFADFGESPFIRLRVSLNRNKCGHSTHGKSPAAMTRPDAGKCIGPHERDGHCYLRTVGNKEVGSVSKSFYVAEQVIPATTVKTG